MSRQNTVEIIVKTKNATGAGLQSVRKDFAKQGDEIKRELDKTEAIVAKSGTRIGENLSKSVAKGAKDAGTKVTEAAEKLKRDLAAAETAAYKEAAKRRDSEQKATQRQLEKSQQEVFKAEQAAYKEAARMRATEEKAAQQHVERLHREIASAEAAAYKEAGKRRADAEKVVASQRAAEEKAAAQHAEKIKKIIISRTESEAKSSGARWAVEFGKSAAGTIGAVLATPIGAGAAAAGLALGSGVIGGLATAFVGVGAVGLGAFLLKDNKQVKDTWTKTLKTIADDSKEAASVMADEFVASGKKTADIWKNDVKPSVEGIFREAQPLVDKLTTGLGKAVADFLPGIETAVKNSGPAVDGFTKLVGTLLKDTGDGLADLSTHSDALGTSLELAGDGIGSAIKGTLGFIGDLSEAVSKNEDDFRRWGKNIGDAADGVGKDIIRLNDLFAATGGDWKSGDGTGFKEAARRFLEGGEDKFNPNKPDPDNNLAKLALPTSVFGVVPGVAAKAFLDNRDLKAQNPTPEGVKVVTEAYKQQDEAASKLTASLDVLNQSKTFGIAITSEELNKADGLMAKQAALAASIQATAKVTGDHTTANYTALTSMLEIAAAGMPVHDSLMQIVAGMTDAQIAALGATVTTDALGNSVVSIPGHKPITITADASQANPPLDGVINRLGQVQSKTVTVRVNSVYSSTNGLGSDGKTFHDQYNKGGWVGGSGGDYDSVPAMLTPKEFVVTRKAAERYGPLLERINTAAGGDVQLSGMGGGTGGGSGSSGGGGGGPTVIELRLVGEVIQFLKAKVRENGGDPSVFGGGG